MKLRLFFTKKKTQVYSETVVRKKSKILVSLKNKVFYYYVNTKILKKKSSIYNLKVHI